MKAKLNFRPSLKVGVACLLGLTLSVGAAYAVAPAAGTIIGNQASATYDLNGQTKTVLSNLVETRVDEVYAVDVTNPQTLAGTAGQTLYFPHTITNNGNATDTFNLTTALSGQVSGVVVYPDLDGNGVPDSFTPITVTPAILMGGTFKVVLAATINAAATAGQTGTATITATSVNDGTQTDSNVDTVNVTDDAVVTITKSMSANSGASPSTPYTVTINYVNTGLKAATAVKITDVLPAGMTYVAGSGLWSASGLTALTDAAAGDPAGINYVYTAGTDTIEATIATVPVGGSGSVTFQVSIDSALPPQVLNNTATVEYDPDPTNAVDPLVTNTSNTVPFTVLQTYAVVVSDTNTTTTDVTSNDDVVEVVAASQGATVAFDNVVKNNGNGTDTFNITTSGSTFPVGTTFTLFKADGVTPLTDTNSDGVPDTGPVAAGAEYHVIMKAVLPVAASSATAMQITKTATSVGDPTKTDTVIDKLNAITPSSVDLTNDAANTLGNGAGPEAAPVTTNTTNPGIATAFDLYINNTSATNDTYQLSFGSAAALPLNGSLGAGWTVVFRDGSATGPVVSSTGIVAPGGQKHIVAVVTPPANAAGNVTTNVYFAAVSQSTGASDVKLDAVTVNAVHDLAIAANSNASVYPNSAYVFTHTLSNQGNVTETSAAVSIAQTMSGGGGWASLIYLDANNDGVLDASDPVFTNLSQITTAAGVATNGQLAAGESVRFFVRMLVPATAQDGDTNTATVTLATVAGETVASNNTLQDIVVVTSSALKLDKTQALDAACDGTADSAFTTAQFDVKPAECVIYRVLATNVGSVAVANVVVSDSTPSYTTYNGGLLATGSASSSAPAVAAAGSVSATWTSIAPAASVTLEFRVRVDN